MPGYPTIVPQADIQQDGLNQLDQETQQANLGVLDATTQAATSGLDTLPPAPPDNTLSPDDSAAAATAKAVSAGADPANLAAARQQLGSQAYTNLCEKFVENMKGTDGQYASAVTAWNQQPDRQQMDLSQIRPGDLVYYGGASENGGYGHAAIYSGNGKVISATSNGVKETPAQGYFAAPMLGFISGGDNQGLAPSPMAAPSGGPSTNSVPATTTPASTSAPGETYGPLAHVNSQQDGLALLDRTTNEVNDSLNAQSDNGQVGSTTGGTWGDGAQPEPTPTPAPPTTNDKQGPRKGVEDFTNAAGQGLSNLGSGVQSLLSRVTGLEPDQPVGPDNQGIAGTPSAQAAIASSQQAPSQLGAGDIANIAGEGAQPLEAVAGALNPKNIGNAVAQVVLDAEGKPMRPEPSFPVVTGAADLASSLTAPGGVLPKAGEFATGAEAAGQAAPSLADAFRAVADHLEGKGVGLVGPGAGGSLPGDVVAGMGANPAPLTDKLAGAQYELNRLLAPAKNTPPEVQAAIRDFANVASPGMGADVQAETLARKVQAVLGNDDNVAAAINFEKTGEFVPNPTPEQAAVADEVRQFTQQTGDAGRLAGYIGNDVTAGGGTGPSQYLMHLYDDTAQQAMQAGSRGLNPKDVYSFQRLYPTLEDAVAAGKSPVDSVSQPIQAYAGKVLDSQAKVDLVNQLKALPNPPAMDMPPAGTRLPDGWVPGSSIAPQFQGVAFTKPVAESLNNILGSGLGNTPVLGGIMKASGLLKENLFLGSGFHGVQELKQSLFANPGVLPVDGAKAAGQALLGAVAPPFEASWRLANGDVITKWANNGITGLAAGGTRGADIEGNVAGTLAKTAIRGAIGAATGASLGYTTAQKTGDSDMDVLKKTLLGGVAGAGLSAALGPQITKAIFEREIPMLKVTTAENLAARLGETPETTQAIATFVNQTYGGQNLAAIARNKGVQDTLRLGVLSPDWWEGWARQIGSAALPNDLGKMSRGYWLRNATIQGAFGLEGLNKAINGHFTNDNEPGHQFDLETTGLIGRNAAGQRQYVDILGPVRPLVQLAASHDVGQFTNTRTSLPVSLAIQDIANKDFAGKPVVPSGTEPVRAAGDYALNAAQRVAPVGLQQAAQTAMTDQNAPDLSQSATVGKTLGQTAFTMATGMRQTAGPAPAELYGQRDKGLASLAEKDPGGLYAAFHAVGMDNQWNQPPASFRQIQLNPDEQLTWQQTRVNFLNTALKPGELTKIQALPPGERDAVFTRLLSDADKVAAGTVLSKLTSDQINARAAVRQTQGKPAARSTAQQQPYNPPPGTLPQFKAPKAA